jgi:hypothetical protein
LQGAYNRYRWANQRAVGLWWQKLTLQIGFGFFNRVGSRTFGGSPANLSSTNTVLNSMMVSGARQTAGL